MTDSTESQCGFEFDDDFNSLLENLNDATQDRAVAEKRFKSHLWALVNVVERRLNKQGIEGQKAYQLSCHIIAEIAHYQGGQCNYLPRGDKLKQELRNIQMFRLWHIQSWSPEKIRNQYCPELNQIQVYKILREARQVHLKKIQPQLI